MRILVFVFLIINFHCVSAQSGKWALGVSGIYDFQTNGYGDGVRVWFPVNKKLSFSPQVHYFYPFNQIHELYAGLALQYNLFSIRKFVFYPHAAGYYNRWFNYDKFSGPKAKPNNVAEEVGFGVMKKQGCVRPFAEQRYDFKWKEFIIHAGVLIFFGDCIGGGRKHELCPAYSHY